MRICVASHNEGKIKEFNDILGSLGYEVLGLKDVGVDLSDFEETGSTFEENAYLKAEHVFNCCHIPTIADDSGLMLDAFPDILGVYSARFMGEDTDYKIKNEKILEMYETVSDRRAMFVSAICFITNKGHKTYVGKVRGTIAAEISGCGGFGYDPLFIPCGYTQTYAQLGKAVKNTMSHRALALKQFIEDIKDKSYEG